MPPPDPLVTIVGFKRARWTPLGGARVLVVRDGRLRVLDADGRAAVDVPLSTVRARTTVVKTIRLSWDGGGATIYGLVPRTAHYPPALEEVAHQQTDIGPGELVASGWAPGQRPRLAVARDANAETRRILAALRSRGVADG